jgi:alkylhydroperoxidase family enzyme
VLEARGAVSEIDLAQARRAGLTDAELIEVIGEVALNTFTNYAYRAAEPELDFPAVEAAPRAA